MYDASKDIRYDKNRYPSEVPKLHFDDYFISSYQYDAWKWEPKPKRKLRIIKIKYGMFWDGAEYTPTLRIRLYPLMRDVNIDKHGLQTWKWGCR